MLKNSFFVLLRATLTKRTVSCSRGNPFGDTRAEKRQTVEGTKIEKHILLLKRWIFRRLLVLSSDLKPFGGEKAGCGMFYGPPKKWQFTCGKNLTRSRVLSTLCAAAVCQEVSE
jgi:hypothetical protein